MSVRVVDPNLFPNALVFEFRSGKSRSLQDHVTIEIRAGFG